MRVGPHHHACQHCGVKAECCGAIQQNYDGWPEWTCDEYHRPNGALADFRCEACAEIPECDTFRGGEDCDGTLGTETRDDSGGYLAAKHFCKGCAAAYDLWLDNYDGPPDGDAWSGGFADNH